MSLNGSTNELMYAMRIIPNNAHPIVTFPSGNVGIGTTQPENLLTVARSSTTDPIADAWTTYSSRRWKANIKPINAALEKVQRLRGVSFAWQEDGKHDIGLIAEEVGEVVPEVVVYEENSQDAKSSNYDRLVAVLIEAVKEQQQVIENQIAELAKIRTKINQLEFKLIDQGNLRFELNRDESSEGE